MVGVEALRVWDRDSSSIVGFSPKVCRVWCEGISATGQQNKASKAAFDNERRITDNGVKLCATEMVSIGFLTDLLKYMLCLGEEVMETSQVLRVL